MNNLHIDFESYSEIDLTDKGAYFYMEHESTIPLMLAWKIDVGMIHLWDIASGEPTPVRLKIALENPSVLLHAYNAQFERLMFKYKLGVNIPLNRWRCTMCAAYRLGFNGKLDNVLDQFLPGQCKDPEGKKLINLFSKPQFKGRGKNRKMYRQLPSDSPQLYNKFKEYCIQDVQVEYNLVQKLKDYPQYPNEHLLYVLDQKINDKGVPVDRELIKRAIVVAEKEKATIRIDLQGLTGLENPNSNKQLPTWMEEKHNFSLPNMQAETIDNAIKDEKTTPIVKEVLKLKRQLSMTSVKKWDAFNKCICKDDRVHGMFQYGGAQRTLRWAGRFVQPHNLPRGGKVAKDVVSLANILYKGGHHAVKMVYGDVLSALSDCIRCAVTAPEGKVLNVTDLGSIESRVLGWMSDCVAINDIFASGRDTYKVFATELFNKSYEEVTRDERDFSKPPVLGGGYMLGVDGLIAYAHGMGVELTKEEAARCIHVFREVLFPEIPKYWELIQRLLFHTVRTGQTNHLPHNITFEKYKDFLFIWLPSGRAIPYHKPKVIPWKMPWGATKDAFTFMGTHKETHQWVRIAAHPGFITENIDQAISRDILSVWMQRIDQAGHDIVLHVHDEPVVESDRDVLEELNDMIRCGVSWAPGLLLDAKGFVTKRYYKD